MITALLNTPTPALTQCELTFMDREPIHYFNALTQHNEYAKALKDAGMQVNVLNVNEHSPDGVFMEDVAIVLDEIAIITSMGTPSRRAELESMPAIIAAYRNEVHRIQLPATIEGGDVLVVGKKLFVGLSTRTNIEGVSAISKMVKPHGYTVTPVKVHGCLHLKTGVTALDDDTVIVNPEWIDIGPFKEFKQIRVANNEPFAANVLRIEDHLIVNAAYPQTAEKIQRAGFKFALVDISEFGKAEAGLTCMSLVFSLP
jgi:dimethylargininase